MAGVTGRPVSRGRVPGLVASADSTPSRIQSVRAERQAVVEHGDVRLEACATTNGAHSMPGSAGSLRSVERQRWTASPRPGSRRRAWRTRSGRPRRPGRPARPVQVGIRSATAAGAAAASRSGRGQLDLRRRPVEPLRQPRRPARRRRRRRSRGSPRRPRPSRVPSADLAVQLDLPGGLVVAQPQTGRAAQERRGRARARRTRPASAPAGRGRAQRLTELGGEVGQHADAGPLRRVRPAGAAPLRPSRRLDQRRGVLGGRARRGVLLGRARPRPRSRRR